VVAVKAQLDALMNQADRRAVEPEFRTT